MKNFLVGLGLVLGLIQVTYAQKLATRSGSIQFEASVASFEEVKATHSNVSAIFNKQTGELASLALVNGFRFKVALMEEHFNENYMESQTYPKATFRGTLSDYNPEMVGQDFTSFNLTGTIELHGQTQDLNAIVRLKQAEGEWKLDTDFILKPEDFNIEIPSVVANKIAEEVLVKVQLTFNDQ